MNRVNLLANDQPSSAVKMAITGLTTSGMKRTTAIKGLFSHFMFLTGVLLITLLTSGKAMAQTNHNVVLADPTGCGLTVSPETLTDGKGESRKIILALAEDKKNTHKLPEANDISIAMGDTKLTLNSGTNGFTYSDGTIALTNDVDIKADITITAAAVEKSSKVDLTSLKYSISALNITDKVISLTPGTYNYTVDLDAFLANGSAITLTATGDDSNLPAVTTNNGITSYSGLTSDATITVTAENGTTQDYTITFTSKDKLASVSEITVAQLTSRYADANAVINALQSSNPNATVTSAKETVNTLPITWTYDNSENRSNGYDPAGGKTNNFRWTLQDLNGLLNTDNVVVTQVVAVQNIAASTDNKLTTLTYQLSGGQVTDVTSNVGNDAGNQTYEVVLPVSTVANAEISIVAKAAEYANINAKGQSFNDKVTLSEGTAQLVLTITAEDETTIRTVTINFTTEAEQVTAVSGVPETYTLSEPVATANAAIELLEKMDMKGITLTANSGATLKLKWEYKGERFDNGSGKKNEFTWTVVKGDGSAIAAKDGVKVTDKITVTNYTASADATLAKLEYKIGEGAAQNIAIADQSEANIAITVPALPFGTSAITLTATATDPLATVAEEKEVQAPVSIEATPESFPIAINATGNTEFKLKVTAEDETTTKVFTLTFSVGEEKEKITKVIVPKEYKLSETVNNANEAISLLEKMEGVTIETNGGAIMKLKWAYNNSDNGSKAYVSDGGKTNVFAWTVVRDGDGEVLEAASGVEITGKTTVTNFIEPITGNDEKVEITKDNPVDKIGDGTTSTIITNVSIAAGATTEQLTINNATINNALTLNESIDEIILNKAIIKEITLAIGKETTLSLQSGNQIDKITNNGTLTLQEAATPAVATLSMAIETRAALDNTGAIKAVENNGTFTDNTASIVVVTGAADLSITSLPADKSTTGSKVTLSVGANSTKGSVSYQWQTYSTGGWTNMSSTAKDLEISKTANGSTQYRCEVKSTASLGSGQVTTLYTPAATVTFRAEGSGGDPAPTPTPKTYTVKLAKVTGATFSQKEETTVAEGGEFSFKITLDKAYDQSKPVVTVDGKAIAAADGSYTIKNIRKDIEIVVSGIVKNTATGMEETIVDAARAWSQGSTLYIHVPEKADVYVFNAGGGLQQQLQGALGDHSMQLRAGFYIVRIGVYTAKVIIR